MQNAKRPSKYFSMLLRVSLVLLLCLISVTGVSYALFTSSIEDGTIGINTTSGEVNVDIVNTNGVSLVDSVLHLSPNGIALEEFRFEPGATVYTEGFRVANVGTVSVNYRMYISRDENIDEAAFAEAFEIYVTRDVSDLQNAEQLMSFEGSLAKDQTSDLFYLVIRMKETAGNKFQNVAYSGIGITVYAVQGNVSIDQVQN